MFTSIMMHNWLLSILLLLLYNWEFLEPILNCTFIDGSLTKCLVYVGSSFCCVMYDFQLLINKIIWFWPPYLLWQTKINHGDRSFYMHVYPVVIENFGPSWHQAFSPVGPEIISQLAFWYSFCLNCNNISVYSNDVLLFNSI